jgi:hypothetical protein
MLRARRWFAMRVAAIALLLAAAGCVSRSEHQETVALLEECRTDKVAAQTSTTSCEERFAREVKRWDDMDVVVAQVLPQSLAEFKSEREEILKLVPDAAREEVGKYLDELTDAMGHGFQLLRDQNEDTLLQLEMAQTKLDSLQARTDSIGTQTTSIGDTLEGSLREAIDVQRGMRQRASDLVAMVQEFDKSHVSVKASESRLKLNRNQRETIEQFHARLIGELTALQASAPSGAPAGDAGSAPTATDALGSPAAESSATDDV